MCRISPSILTTTARSTVTSTEYKWCNCNSVDKTGRLLHH